MVEWISRVRGADPGIPDSHFREKLLCSRDAL